MKVFKGGYKIVSLLNIDITSDFTIPGIYDDIKDSHGKPILVSEINVGGEKMNDAYTIVKQDNTDYIIEVYGYSLTIASDDSVTVASLPEITSIGTGLTLTDGELSADGGGGSSTLYQHNISFASTTGAERIQVSITLVTTDSTAFVSTSDVATYIRTKTNSAYITASGLWHLAVENAPYVVVYLLYFSATDVYGLGISLSDYTVITNSSKTFSGLTVTDRVVEIS